MKCLITTLKESVTIENPVFFDSAEGYVLNDSVSSSAYITYNVKNGKTVVAKDKDGTVRMTLIGDGTSKYASVSSDLVGKTLYFMKLSDINTLKANIISFNIKMYKNATATKDLTFSYSYGNIETLTKLTSLINLNVGQGVIDHVTSGSLNVLAKGQVDNGRVFGVMEVYTQSSQNLTYNGSKIDGHYRILFGTSMESPTETDTANGYQVRKAN